MLRARSRQYRALVGAFALAIGGVASPVTRAAPSDDWSLERQHNDANLVSQRMLKLQRSPFDSSQWRALVQALGQRGLAERIRSALRARPHDPALAILDARMVASQGDPADAAQRLAALQGQAGRWDQAVFDQRIQWLEAAADYTAAVQALTTRAHSTAAGATRDEYLQRAQAMAERGDLHPAAMKLAQTLAQAHPKDSAAQLRLARSADRAGEARLADETYARAIALSSARARDDLIAERAQARLNADNPGGATELLWTLLEPTGRGARSVRAGWWDQLADAHRRAGTTDLLVSRLTAWLTDHPNEASAWRTLAQAQQTAGFDSIEAWRMVLKRSSRDAQAHRALVEALEAKGQTQTAVDEYRRLITQHPAEIELGLELANRLIGAGDREQGLSIARDIEQRSARKPKPLLLLLDFYNLNDQSDQALEVAERVVSLRPRSADARVALGEQLYQMGRVDEALEQWARLPKLIRPTHRGLAKHAEVLSEHGRTSDAVEVIKQAIKLQPQDPQYLRLRAMLAEDQRRPGLAMNLWEQIRTLATAPQHALLRDEARTRVVEFLVGGPISQRRSKLLTTEHQAQAQLDAGTPLEDAIEAGRLLAELYTRQENYASAVAVQRQLFELAPDDPDRLFALAAAQRRAGQVTSALGTLEDLLEAEPNRSADTLAEMSELAFEAGDSDRALDAARQAARQDRSRVDALIHLGELHERHGDTGEARRAYRQAVEAEPRDIRARLRLAELSLTLGDTHRSSAALREILDLGGPPELLRAAGRRALDLAEASGTTHELFALAVQRTIHKPEADEPRQFLLDTLDRTDQNDVERWLDADDRHGRRSAERVEHLRRPLVTALSRGSIGTRVRAAEHLGRLRLPETALPLATLGTTLRAPRDSTATVLAAFDRARVTAIAAAGQLRDPAAIPEFRDLLLDGSQSARSRHAAAWALVGIGGPEVGEIMSPLIESGHDPLLTSLGCLAWGRGARTPLDQQLRAAISATARDHADRTVRHACAFAEAATTPDHHAQRLRDQLRATDPMLAAIAAWRLGRSAQVRHEDVHALLLRYLGPFGLPRDAAAAALVALLERHSNPQPPPTIPSVAYAHLWSMAIERWLKAQVAPPIEPLPPSVFDPWRADLRLALQQANSGTRAEQDAARRALCPRRPQGPTIEQTCLVPLVDGPIRLSQPD